ncbi:MAG: zinc-dependent alcohol dehydrogenase family protein [Kiritimatiellaeota bacterium]|nr:zinc-dependent alcohol dehydrogenase family protein [Kiritimatiellota bacterium]
MKAAVLDSPGPIETGPLQVREIPAPSPGPGQVRLRVRVCGVCHTDLHTVEGDLELPRLPLIPGHQIVGTVDAVGPGVEAVGPGERVGVTWLYSSCGECGYCRRGLENLCDRVRFTGLHADGGYAEYAVVPAAFVHRLPAGFPDLEAAPLLCAGVIGYRSLRLSGVRPGERLGLYGFGASAHVCIQIARYWGCEVYVFTRSEEHRRHARELGAVWTGEARDTPPAELDAAVTFAPVGWIVPEALRVLRKGGTLAVNAVHLTPIPELPYSRIYFEKTLRSVANCTRRDARELLDLAVRMGLRTDVESYPLAEANQVLERLKRSEVRGAAVLQVGVGG